MSPLAWRQLGEEEFAVAWEKYYAVPPPGTPLRAFRIPDSFDSRLPALQPLLAEFHGRLLRAFRDCLPLGRKMFALDYHHPSFEFDPHVPFESGPLDPGHWPVTVLPEGDDTIYVAHDLSFGTTSAWDPQSITFFGEALLERLAVKRPRLLDGWERV
ncbi:MAG: DUF2716 domain-containing protein [Planctomycetes bacterium]|nr:DUF2716 domain-containing protein [Planctomycetota bacterium]